MYTVHGRLLCYVAPRADQTDTKKIIPGKEHSSGALWLHLICTTPVWEWSTEHSKWCIGVWHRFWCRQAVTEGVRTVVCVLRVVQM